MILRGLSKLGATVTERCEDPFLTMLLSLASDSFVYFIGSGVIGVGNVVLVPLYTRYLSPAEFGVYTLVDIAVLVMVAVVGLGFNMSYLRWYVEVSEGQRSVLLNSMLLVSTIAALLGGGGLAGIAASLVGEKWLQTGPKNIAWTLFPLVLLENLQVLLLTDLRARRDAVAFSLGSVIRVLGMIGFSLWFVAVQKEGVRGVLLGRIAGDTIGVLLLLWVCFQHPDLHFSWELVKPMLRYGLPLIYSSLMAMLLDASGRYFLSHYGTLEQVGFYGAGIKISNLMRVMVVQPFGVAWGGLMFRIAKQSDAELIYSKLFAYILTAALAVALGIALFSPTIFALFTTPAYTPALQVFPLLLLVQVCTVLQYPASVGLYLKEKTHLFLPIYAVALATAVVSNRVLTPTYGMIGCAAGSIAGWIAVVGLESVIGQRYYALHYDWGAIVFAVLLVSGALVVGRHWAPGVHLRHILLQGALLLVVITALGGWSFWDYRRYRMRSLSSRTSSLISHQEAERCHVRPGPTHEI
ncbi:MAG: oligosaccharide flippase family protein [Chloroflexi bacterium]|nr:oligosaccharide flippase family protein [Chloroflexota bacterium]